MQQRGDHASNVANINILEWITKPRTFSKGQNLPFHIKAVKRFLINIKAPEEYHQAILVNSLDEECQLELFAHPEYKEENTNFEELCALITKVFDTKTAGFSKLVRLLDIKQEANESLSQFLARLRIEAYKMFGDGDKEQKERYIISAFINGIKNKSIAKAIETLEPDNSELVLKMAKRAEEQSRREDSIDCCGINLGKEPSTDRKRSEKEEFEDMKRQIQFLTEQVMYLSNKLRFQNNRPPTANNRRQTYAGVVRNGIQAPQIRPATNNIQTNRPPRETRGNN